MDNVRYLIALGVLLIIPTNFMLWAPIHGFSGFWRKFGFFGTYGILGFPAGIAAAVIIVSRDSLLRVDFGRNPFTLLLSLVCFGGVVWLSAHCRKHLTFSVLAGMPELAQGRYPGQLLTAGIYASIRHPRYVEVSCGLVGCVLFANYLMPYLCVLAGIPGMCILVWLEERELRQRFGAQYEAYCRRVPRFIPRIWANKHSGKPG